jgi:hypothetical protein
VACLERQVVSAGVGRFATGPDEYRARGDVAGWVGSDLAAVGEDRGASRAATSHWRDRWCGGHRLKSQVEASGLDRRDHARTNDHPSPFDDDTSDNDDHCSADNNGSADNCSARYHSPRDITSSNATARDARARRPSTDVSERQLHQLRRKRGVQPVPEPERSARRRNRAVQRWHLLLLAAPLRHVLAPWRRCAMVVDHASQRPTSQVLRSRTRMRRNQSGTCEAA